MTVTVVHADGFFVDSTHDIPNTEPNFTALRTWKELFPTMTRQVIITCDSELVGKVGPWLRHYGIEHSYVYPLPNTADVSAQMRKIVGHVAGLHTKIDLFLSTSMFACNWMAGVGVPSMYFIHPRAEEEQFEEDLRSSWEKQSAGIADVVEDIDIEAFNAEAAEVEAKEA